MTRAVTVGPVDALNWVDVFVCSTDRFADGVYARHGARELTYGQLRDVVDSGATALLRAGVRPGQVVAVFMTNSLDFLIAQWMAYRAGCALLPLYSYYRDIEIRHALTESRAAVLVTSADFAGKVDSRSILTGLLPELEQAVPGPFAAAPDLKMVVGDEALNLPGVIHLSALTSGEPDPEALAWVAGRVAPFDLMNIMYTSGTTGVPKAGLSLHSNNLASIRSWLRVHPLGPQDVILCHVPMFTNFGCLYANALAMHTGAVLEITATFDASESLRLIRDAGVTYIPGSPEIFRLLLDHPDAASTSFARVRGAHVAGSSADPATLARIVELIPGASQAYGMSECGGVSTMTTAADPLPARLATVGRALPNVRIKIVDPQTLAELPADATGEIWFGDVEPGSCVGKGYLASPEATSAAITASGWFRSGDLGRLGDDGYLYFVGRLKNMITVGGFNVYPAEVERHLLAHEAVATAAVVGVPDPRLGTVPAAFVVLRAGATADSQSLIAFLRARVSSQKQPRLIEVISQDELPMTPSGKIHLPTLERRAADVVLARRAASAG
jgi:acyl-CoA synthetase (AMP-forming)/AMP-acid ligase II